MPSASDERALSLLSSDDVKRVGPNRDELLRLIFHERLELDIHARVARDFQFLPDDDRAVATYAQRVVTDHGVSKSEGTAEILRLLLTNRTTRYLGQSVVTDAVAHLPAAGKVASELVARFDDILQRRNVHEWVQSLEDHQLVYRPPDDF